MDWQDEQAGKAMRRAVKAARIAYEFGASSYTYAALVECLRALDAVIGQPDWIMAYLDYLE